MNNFVVKKAKIAIGLILAVLTVWLLAWFGIFDLINANSAKGDEPKAIQKYETVEIKVNFGNESLSKGVPFSDGQTAFGLLEDITKQNNIALTVKKYDFGIFVESINQIVSGPDASWIYFINGQSGTVAADQYKIMPGDIVEWKYITPTQ